MTTASSIIQSDWIDSKAEWPMQSYLSAWRIFRSFSDEGQVTADHLLSRRLWPHSLQNPRVADFGCGDGRIIKSVLLSSRKPINTLHLIDINSELLDEAKNRIENLALTENVVTSCKSAAEAMQDIGKEIDVALAIHLVYLLKAEELKEFFSRLPINVPLFIVMDRPTSVFTKLWERTSPKYHSRTLEAHNIISTLSHQGYLVEKTEFDTHLSNPLNLRNDVKSSVLSLLCYRDLNELDQATQSWVNGTILEHSTSERVICDCACYEVIRKS